jgi:hypothetical protein
VEVTKNERVDCGSEGMPAGAKARSSKIERFRGFENPLPGLKVRGWHDSLRYKQIPDKGLARSSEA